MQVLHVRAVARPAHALVRVDPRRRLDLDHVGAEVGELPHAGRAGAHARQVENPEARQARWTRRCRHGNILVVVSGVAWTAAPRCAQFPERPIRLVVPQAAGSATDNIARLVAPEMAKILGQPVVVDNRPGGALTIGIDAVAKAAPDGYTIGQGPVGALAITRHMVAKLPYDIERDLQPVALVTTGYMLLAVSPKTPFHSVKRTDRLREEEPRQALQRLLEQRLARARERRAVQVHDRHRHRAHPVQGRRAGDRRPDLRPGAAHVREHQLDRAARQGRPRARAGGHRRAARAQPAARCRR